MTNQRLARHGRLRWVLASTLLLAACGDSRAPSDDTGQKRPAPASPVAAAMQLGVTPLALDDRGLPRLLRASDVVAPAPAATATESALTHLGRLSAAWGVADTALPKLQGIGEVPAPGAATIARVRQTIDGLPVDGGELRVMVRGNGELVATNGVLVSADKLRQAAQFPIGDAHAVARAVAHNFKRDFAPGALAQKELRRDGSRTVRGRHGGIDVQIARARKVWHDTGHMLIPAWVVEAYAGDVTSTSGDAFRTMLTADGSRVISHRSLTDDIAFNYRVFADATSKQPADGPVADFSPHPTGTPNGQFPAYVPSTLVSVDGLNTNPTGGFDSWLPSTRTETFGNNVEAYTDLNAPTGFTFGDFRATVTATRTFDRAYDLNAGPLTSQAQQMAAITSAFYGINWLHDFWYDAGFNEAAGNGQDTNTFGGVDRGGEDRDALLAETQDNALGGSLNNANMSTPADGLPPRMQIFVWTGKDDRKLTIQPANRTPPVGGASFGPTSFDTTAPIVLGVDGAGASVNDGCEPLTNTVTSQLVLVDRGNCSFKLKALNIQTAGGAGMILADNAVSPSPPALGNDAAITTPITIGSLSVTNAEGATIKTELGAGAVSGTSHRLLGPQLDGSLDSTLLAHEFGHYVHRRLQVCTTPFCSAQSEGWGDFLALMSMAREGDNYDGAYPFSIYTTQSFTTDPGYFGIRRAPYSADPAINALSYRHMADGEPLPTNHPILVFGNNAEVHNAGEIWAQTMWEVYAALLKAPGATFAATRAKMAKYVVSGLMMAPGNSTPTETRDAILLAASEEDRPIMMAAFARRGMGSCAVTPPRNSVSFVGIVDSTEIKGNAVAGAVAFAEAESCDDDDILDAGETATIALPIANQGHVELTNVKVTVTSATQGIGVVSAPVEIASLAPGASQDVMIEVKLDKGVAGPLAGDFAVKVESSNGCTAELTVSHTVRLNIDDVPSASANDTFDAKSVWKTVPETGTPWSQINESPLDRLWHGLDVSGITDTTIESPALSVGTTAPFRVTFSHAYQFEHDGTIAWDGGVIEYSVDDGMNWADVASLPGVSPGYTDVLTTQADNPLGTRMAFSGQNASYPSPDTVSLDFGTQLAGMTVKLRFRIGTDQAVGAEGWKIDDLMFEGITNTPFPSQVEDRTMCGVETPSGPDAGMGPKPPLPPVDEQPGCCDSGRVRGSSLMLALGVLGLLLRRRRRR